MWYFSWVLGLGLAIGFGILNGMWHEFHLPRVTTCRRALTDWTIRPTTRDHGVLYEGHDPERRCVPNCAVRDRALCGSLDDRELVALNSIGQRRHVARGQTIAWAGEEAVICGNLLSGVLKLVAARGRRTRADGRLLLIRRTFSDSPMRAMSTSPLTALTDAELCVFPRAAFERACWTITSAWNACCSRDLRVAEEARGGCWCWRASRPERSWRASCSTWPRERDQRMPRQSRRAGHLRPAADAGQIADVLGMTIETVSAS